MKQDYKAPLAVQMAADVLNMHHELKRLREENEELRQYRKKYIELLDADIAHGRHMVGGLLELAIKPGVLDAVAVANERA
jgi:ferric-dicitrate binding protein FerR (iron transport regulator)